MMRTPLHKGTWRAEAEQEYGLGPMGEARWTWAYASSAVEIRKVATGLASWESNAVLLHQFATTDKGRMLASPEGQCNKIAGSRMSIVVRPVLWPR